MSSRKNEPLGGGGEHGLRVRRAVHARRLVQRTLALPDDARITGDRQNRIGIRHRHGKPGEQVEAAGPGGREAHAQAVGINGVAAGHERGGLLMAHDHRPDLGGVLERNHGAGGVFAGAAKGGIDAHAFQRLDDRLVHTHRSRAPRPPEEYRDGSANRLRPIAAESIDRLERFNCKSRLCDLRQRHRGGVRFCHSKAPWARVFS